MSSTTSTASTTAATPVVVNAIAKPLAGEKLEKKLFRLVKKAKKDKFLRRGGAYLLFGTCVDSCVCSNDDVVATTYAAYL